MIAKSAMDSLYTDDIEYNKENVLVIIEGLSMYLHENDIRQIFSIIEKAFNKSTVMIETMSPFFVKHMKEKSIEGSNAKFSWGVKNGKDLQQIVPAFNWKRDVSLVEGMKEIMPRRAQKPGFQTLSPCSPPALSACPRRCSLRQSRVCLRF